MDIGQKIKLLREEQGLTLEELGKKVGVGKSTVRKWETGLIANMRRDKIAKVAEALNVDPSFLMGWDTKQLRTSGQTTLLDDIPVTTPLSYGEHALIKSFRNHTSAEQADFIKICNKYDSLTEQGKIMFLSFLDSMDSVPGMIKPISVDSSQLQASDCNGINIFDFFKEINSEKVLNAAHERTDIKVTEKMRKHDDDIMDEEDF